jgi:predicted RNase H-like HicB family nuclease
MKPKGTRASRDASSAVEYRFTAVFEPAEEGGYVVTVPALPGLVTEAESLEEARRMVKEAVLGYLESLRKHGDEIPSEREAPRVEQVAVRLSEA